jgi:cytolysin (calcineurin-like family phosphatase)
MRNFTLRYSLLALLAITTFVARSQNVAINTTGTAANASAILDLSNTASLAFLAPQVALTNAATLAPVPNPGPAGLLVYNTNNSFANGLNGSGYYYWNGAGWLVLSTGSGSAVTSVTGSAPIVITGTATAPNVTLQGVAGSVFYGTGGGSAASGVGTTGQFLESQGAGAPIWANTSSVGTKNIAPTGNNVIAVGNGTNQVVNTALGNVSLDVVGTNGGVMYGTGPSSNFTAAGTAGQFLSSTGAGAPVWTNSSSVGTKNIATTGNGVVAVTNGTNQVVNTALGSVGLDVVGPSGGVMYGTGTSSNFNGTGITGQILESKGAAAPVWASPNALLTTYGMSSTGNNVVNIVNGANQIVTSNATFDVVGTNGGVMYGTGPSSNFTAAGTAGQFLESTGAGAPAWANTSSVGTKNIASGGNNVVTVTNGTNQVVNTALGNVSLDVTGTAGAVMYGTGASSKFNAAGSAGQLLESQGAGAPIWASPNSLLTTYGMTSAGNNVVTIVNGANQIVTSNATFDVKGTAGAVMYGTGPSSNFNAAGTTGQILESQGAAAPVWASANSLLTTYGMSAAGNGVVTIVNGANQIVTSNATFDVKGTNGGVMYGTGPSSNFTAAGTAGQFLSSTGAGAPVWTNTSSVGTKNIATTGNGVIAVGNGTAQVVNTALGNVSLDVVGTNGGVMYGTGPSSNFTAAGTSGQFLQSTGAGAPVWATVTVAGSKNIQPTGNNVVAVTNGTNQVVNTALGNVSLDVVGTNGGVMYGTGASSNFNAAGTSGQILESQGAAAPVWASPNSLLTTYGMSSAGNNVVTIVNGANQIVTSNATFDVKGTNGGVMYGTGPSSNFTAAGTAGQFLSSTGAGAPIWTNTSSVGTKNIATTGNGVVAVTNGTAQVVNTALGNVGLDVVGTNGGVMYGTGPSSNFTAAGTSGQFLQSTGAGAPVWATVTVAGSKNIQPTGNNVVAVTNGTNQVVNTALGNVSLDVVGTNGGVMYGTGPSSNFTAAGTAGQFLSSTGAGAPVWTNTSSVGTKNIATTGNGVIAVGNGTAQVVNTALGNVSLDVVGPNGGVMYGTGVSSNFNGTGITGQILESKGAAAPVWASPNALLTTYGMSSTGNNVVNIVNGANQIVTSNATFDVVGTNGGVMYGTGPSSNFTAAGTAGQFLASTGAGAPAWTNTSSVGTKNIASGGNNVVTVTNGTNQVVNTALGNVSLDVSGTAGAVMYGTGASSKFNAAGTAGQILESQAAGAPIWASPNSLLTTYGMTSAGNNVVTIVNGANQIVTSNATFDVKGTNGGVMYGTGPSSNFTAAGTAGQFLSSTGAGAPIWTNTSSVGTKNIATTGNGVIAVGNGTAQVVNTALGNVSLDVVGTNGGVMYGTGPSSDFTAAGTAGQFLESTGAGAPIWATVSATGSKSILTAGNNVIAVTNGTNQVVNTALGNVGLDVVGTAGAVMYGTGASSDFNAAGTTGQVLESKGAAAPVWASPNSLLTTYGMSSTGNNVVSIVNGANQIVTSNATFDVVGTNGGVMYGTGPSSKFTAAGTAGQFLASTGAGAPIWTNTSSVGTKNIATAGNGVVAVTNGTAQVVNTALGNVGLDVVGTNGGVMYGTGPSSNFTAAGTAGQYLQSTGAGAPVWATVTVAGSKNIQPTGNNVIAVTNGTNQVVNTALGNVSLDVTGTAGAVMYGTGASSNFNAAGTTGQILESKGAAAPVWATPNSLLTTYGMTSAGNNVVTIVNGANQIVTSNATFDVKGTAGAVMYGTGASSNFNAVGTSGYLLESQGAAAPIWVNPATLSSLTANNGCYMSSATNVQFGTNPLIQNTTLPLAGFTLTETANQAGPWNLNYAHQVDNSNAAGTALAGINTAGFSAGQSGTGVFGQTTQPNGYGVYGTNAAGVGVYGNGSTYGVEGVAAGSVGVLGSGTTGTEGNGTAYGIYGIGPVAVYGDANASTNSAGGSFANNGGACYTYAAYYNGTSYYGIYTNSPINTTSSLNVTGNFVAGGTKSTVVEDKEGNSRLMFCSEAPEVLFEDFGTAALANGRVHIDLDELYAKNVAINEKHPLRVIITMNDECPNTVYVANRTATGFDVVENNHGTSNASFTYEVVANRADVKTKPGEPDKNYSDRRFTPYEFPVAPPAPKSPATAEKK